MKKNPSGLALLKQKNPLGTLKNDPDILDRQMKKMEADTERGEKEGTEPMIREIHFSPYKGSHFYTITCDGIIKGLSGEPMKYIFYPNKLGPRVRIKRLRKKIGEEGIFSEYYEINILKEMKRFFKSYIEGYSKAKDHLDDYILLPKDGNWENLATTNLYFCSKKEYRDQGSKRELLKTFLAFSPELSNTELEARTGVSLAHISRVKVELAQEGKLSSYQDLLDLRNKTGIQIEAESLPLYQALLESQGELSNLEIVKQVRPHEWNYAITNEAKRVLADKVVRARKKLTDKGLIPRYNAHFEAKKAEALQLLNEKHFTGKTNKEIAEILGLKKEQIDNLAKQMKKSLKCATRKES